MIMSSINPFYILIYKIKYKTYPNPLDNLIFSLITVPVTDVMFELKSPTITSAILPHLITVLADRRMIALIVY